METIEFDLEVDNGDIEFDIKVDQHVPNYLEMINRGDVVTITEGIIGQDTIANYLLAGANIKSIILPNVKEAGDRAFDGAKIEHIDLPNLKQLGQYCFAYSVFKSDIVTFDSIESCKKGE